MLRLRLPIVFFFGCVLASGPVIAQDQSETAKLRAAETQLTEYYKLRQVQALAEMLDEDFVITFEDGSTLSKTGYVSFMAAPSDHVEIAEMTEMRIRIHGDTGIVTGIYHEKGNTKGQAYDYHDRFTDVWMKEAGRWRLIASHYALPLKP